MPDYRIGGKRGLPLDADRPFDRQAAADSMFAAAGWPDNPDPAKARRGFVVYEADADPALKGGYHLPFARVVDGTLKAVPNGVRNAKSRLPQLGGVSQDVVDRGNALLDSYMERIHGESGDDSEKSVNLETRGLTFLSTAEVYHRAQTGLSESDLLKRLRDRAPDPSVFEDFPPYFFSAVISSNAVDSFFTRMMPSTLRNYAEDATDGVTFQIGHESPVGIGRSLNGQFVGGQGDGNARVVADFFVPQHYTRGGVDVDGFVVSVRSGTAKPLSVGFHGGEMRCSLPWCGLRMLDLRALISGDDNVCLHVPGVSYPAPADGSRAARKSAVVREMAVGLIEGARLAHVADVSAGSNPNAVIIKAQSLADAGRLQPAIARALESRYATRIIGADPIWALGTVPCLGEEPAPPVEAEGDNDDGEPVSPPEAPMGDIQIPEAALRAFRSLVPKERIPVEADATAVVEAATTHVRELQERLATREQVCKDIAQVLNEAGCTEAEIGPGVRWLLAENKRMAPLADIGRTYRADLIEDTLKEGVAADGNAFAREMWSGVLGRSTLEEIKAIRVTFTAKADAKAGGGGRKINDRPGDSPKQGDDDERTNMRAFRVRAG